MQEALASVIEHPALQATLARASTLAAINAVRMQGWEQGHAVANLEARGRVARASSRALATGLLVGGAIGSILTLTFTGWLS